MSEIRIGRPQTSPTAPSHVRGVREGNKPGSLKRERGIKEKDGGARATPRRSTGINPTARKPILPTMPTLTPP